MLDDTRFLRSGVIDELFPRHPDAWNVIVPGRSHPVRFRFLLDKLGPGETQITLCIQIDEDTAQRDLEAAWAAVEKWRDLIKYDEQHFPWVGDEGAYFKLWRDHEEGASYRALADRVNATISSYLCGTDDSLRATYPDGTPLLTKGQIAQMGKNHALDILRIARPGLSEAERCETIELALGEIRAGRAPFMGAENPVTSDDIKQRIRGFIRRWDLLQSG